MGILTLFYTAAQVAWIPKLNRGFDQLVFVISGAPEIMRGFIMPSPVPTRLLACFSCGSFYPEVQGPGGQPVERGDQVPREATVSGRRDGSAAESARQMWSGRACGMGVLGGGWGDTCISSRHPLFSDPEASPSAGLDSEKPSDSFWLVLFWLTTRVTRPFVISFLNGKLLFLPVSVKTEF